MRSAFAAAIVIVSAALVAPAASAATTGQVRGTVRGLPAGGVRVFAVVRAIDRVNGRVVAATTLGRTARRYRLKVPPGRYFIAIDAAGRPGGNVSRLGRSVRVRARRTAGHDVTVRAAEAAPVVGVDEINLTTEPGLPLEMVRLRALAINQVFNALSRRGIKVVDDSAQVVAAMKTEERLSKEGRSDTRFVAHPLKPTVRLAGSGTLRADGTVALDLALVRPDGTVLAMKSFSAKPDSMGAFGAFLTQATSSFATENADQVEETAPTRGPGIHVVITTHMETWDGNPHGLLTITPPGVTDSSPAARIAFDGMLPFGSTVRAEARPADAQSYFAGWTGTHCGNDRPPSGYNPTWVCTVGPENALDAFIVDIVPEFDKCPPPGTYVFGGGAETCPGVIPSGGAR